VAEGDLDELWGQVIASWDEAAVHEAFLLRCRAEKQLGVAAARYREVIQRSTAYREDGNRAETARKRLQSLTELALGDLEALRSDPVVARPLLRLFVRVSLILFALAGLCFAALSR
jgi:hypothetical protein